MWTPRGQRWDDTCPHCETKINYDEYLCERHASADWQSPFKMACPHCLGKLEVEVRVAPEFGIAKKEGGKVDEGPET